ncbi:acyl carrier protein [Microbispora amethystogenes]|nr:acyl carrier protein [Microbispora cellulosiformans]
MNELITLVAGILDMPAETVDENTGTATAAEWSSLRHVQIIGTVERAYGVRLSAREARACRSVGALRDTLRTRGVAV